MRLGLWGSTAIVVSFCGAAAVSRFTVTSGPSTVVPSRGLERTNVGVMGGVEGSGLSAKSLTSASSSINAEKRICRPAVPLTEATLPASVVMSNVDCALTTVGIPLTVPPTTAATSTSMETKAACFIATPPNKHVTLNWHALGGQMYASEDTAILLIVRGASGPGREV